MSTPAQGSVSFVLHAFLKDGKIQMYLSLASTSCRNHSVRSLLAHYVDNKIIMWIRKYDIIYSDELGYFLQGESSFAKGSVSYASHDLIKDEELQIYLPHV